MFRIEKTLLLLLLVTYLDVENGTIINKCKSGIFGFIVLKPLEVNIQMVSKYCKIALITLKKRNGIGTFSGVHSCIDVQNRPAKIGRIGEGFKKCGSVKERLCVLWQERN